LVHAVIDPLAYRPPLDCERATLSGLIIHHRIRLTVETAEAAIIDPIVLYELELSGYICVQADEENAALLTLGALLRPSLTIAPSAPNDAVHF